MYGTTQALIVAAIALQASAKPVRLFERQASNSSATITSASITPLTTLSPLLATSTATGSIPEPSLPSFPFPGSNGTYYICSFPSSNTTVNSTEPLTSTVTASTASATTSVSATLTSGILTSSGVSTSSASASATKPVPITSLTSVVPTATPTTFTVVGPSTTTIIECIPVPTGAHPHPPSPGNNSSVSSVPLPTVTSNTLTSSVPTSSLSSTIQGRANEIYVTDYE